MTEFLTSTLAIIIYVVLGLAAVAGVGFAVAKSRKELPPAPQRPQLETPKASETHGEAAEGALENVETVDAPVEAEPEYDKPETAVGRMERLRSRLAGSGRLGATLLAILSKGDLSEADWEEFEDTLLMADLGLDATEEILGNLRKAVQVKNTTDPAEVKELLRAELLKQVNPELDRSLNLSVTETAEGKRHPAVVLMVGVNGTGKTTTVGKLARLFVAEDRKVVLGAADTFRAAAAEQLTTWGDRVGIETVRSEQEGADPASVAFDAVKRGQEVEADVVLVDTAGRLQNKSTLMDELGKVKRVMEKRGPVSEVLLVLDATTGQNGLRQAQVFAEVVDVTGVVLTKLDGSAKGGVVVSVQRELGVPVKLVGLGEGADDLAPFNPADFVDAILN
ncbi:signal recognition particle-docking protein FtsY [Gleimia coleocanis DSM 15436]|uniref:Signal recognition particle receptor FtsY n=1 Tax=Gleimia coleocanis DSM 15436 TaxID=525245 RepID=C0W175_9ACTO|nr:signal recognition particle-docking protein FtsY [Gleimia coleocanis]EEH63564.1 signal recognition particle-docking protein FtsY [Gleimia coleocanis DSM 15436]